MNITIYILSEPISITEILDKYKLSHVLACDLSTHSEIRNRP